MFNCTMNSLLESILEAASSANVSGMEVFREVAGTSIYAQMIARVAGSAEILAEVTRASFEQNANWLREFSETSEVLHQLEAPGTFRGDYFRVANPTSNATEREAALARLVERLSSQPVAPRAKGALRHLASERGVPRKTILAELMPPAVLLAIDDVDCPQPIRIGSGKGSYYVKNSDGHKAKVIPSEHFDLGELAKLEAHLKQRVRNLVEEDLIDRGRDRIVDPGDAPTDDEDAELFDLAAHTPPPEILMRETIERKQREDAEDAALLSLTRKEREIAELIKETDYTDDEICRELKIGRDTLRVHRQNMRRKFSTGI
jgi:DNA-binding CsgD family transcriptional regulator